VSTSNTRESGPVIKADATSLNETMRTAAERIRAFGPLKAEPKTIWNPCYHVGRWLRAACRATVGAFAAGWEDEGRES